VFIYACVCLITTHVLRFWLLGISAQSDFNATEASQLFLHKGRFNSIHCETEEEEKDLYKAPEVRQKPLPARDCFSVVVLFIVETCTLFDEKENSILKYALCSYVDISFSDQQVFGAVYCLNVVSYRIAYIRVVITINAVWM
jgi:hypothetical protein